MIELKVTAVLFTGFDYNCSMKIFFVMLLEVLLCTGSVYGQVERDSVHMMKSFWRIQFYQKDMSLSTGQLAKILETDREAYEKFKRARTPHIFANILGTAGGVLLGWQVGVALWTGDPNWAIAGAGAGLVAVSLPLVGSFNRRAVDAVEIYNRGLATTAYPSRHRLLLGLSPAGLQLTWKL